MHIYLINLWSWRATKPQEDIHLLKISKGSGYLSITILGLGIGMWK